MILSLAAGKSADKKDTAKEDRRSKVDRRKFSYTEYIPERRSNDDRRKGEDEQGKSEDNNNE